LFLWIGDNIYGDSLYPEILQEEYRRQRDVASLQPILHSVSHLAVWDDHDFGLNNQNKSNPIKESALTIFKQYWANPSYGLPEVPGIFFRYSYGDVDFFFLDDRYYRDADLEPDTPDKTLLGASQLSWLKTELTASNATFKVLVAGSGWNKGKGVGEDSWAAFLNERNKIFDFIRDHEISGVVLLSGDTHVGELNVIPWSEKGGYDYYDFGSSPLAQGTPDSWLERRPERRIRSVYFQGSNFGLVEFFFEPTPRLTYRLIDTQGRSVWETFEVTAEELVNGVTSWPSKVSELERLRQLDYEAGKGYYEVIHED
jgi:alkaline phosphatase D